MKNIIAGMFHRKTLEGGVDSQEVMSSGIGGIGCVDLGLSVRWATCNVGAKIPSDCGSGFAWGETAVKEGYWLANSLTAGREIDDFSGQSSLDAAFALWGGTWRMPTLAEMEELVKHCNWIWTKVDGRRGYLVKSRVNANTIFLPTADDRLVYGRYWTSTPHPQSLQDAFGLYFDRGSFFIARAQRYGAQFVRPVMN